MVPTSTKTIAMTIATMGRLIKNFDIALPSLSFRGEWFGGHLHAGSYFLNAFGNNAFALFQSFRNNPLVADAVARLDRPNPHFVVAVPNCDFITPLQLRN